MLFTFIFVVLIIGILWKLIKFAVKMSWGLIKVLFYIVLAPVVLIIFFASGLIYIALALAIVMGIITLIATAIA